MPKSELLVQVVYSGKGLRGLRDAGRDKSPNTAVTQAVARTRADQPHVAMPTRDAIRCSAISDIIESPIAHPPGRL
ncbi:MAG TPA: hypothetical protein VKZ50_08625 [bacterium]|nr:hypothetical protein [bacterium]